MLPWGGGSGGEGEKGEVRRQMQVATRACVIASYNWIGAWAAGARRIRYSLTLYISHSLTPLPPPPAYKMGTAQSSQPAQDQLIQPQEPNTSVQVSPP